MVESSSQTVHNKGSCIIMAVAFLFLRNVAVELFKVPSCFEHHRPNATECTVLGWSTGNTGGSHSEKRKGFVLMLVELSLYASVFMWVMLTKSIPIEVAFI